MAGAQALPHRLRHGVVRLRFRIRRRIRRSRRGLVFRARGVLAPEFFERDRPRALAKHRDTDHADVVRTAGTRGVRIGQRGEVERRGARHALAPARDVGTLVRREDVAGLLHRCRVAGNHIDAVDTHDREDATGRAVAHPNGVFVAGLADDVAPALMPVHRQYMPLGAVDDLDARLCLRQHAVRLAVYNKHRRGERGGERDARHRKLHCVQHYFSLPQLDRCGSACKRRRRGAGVKAP